MQMLKDVRCGNCNRLLARAAGVTQLQIKCSRCGTLNHVKTSSLEPSPASDFSGIFPYYLLDSRKHKNVR
ncbi:Com family DNA-binding transcriptional regulator [Pseudomonas alabamensis]|uniref:Com family DNA-binding transcriptional regulator n=1 Tax=Pseudomonas alabamensis TaxID=3064349 RepID=UPI003F652337